MRDDFEDVPPPLPRRLPARRTRDEIQVVERSTLSVLRDVLREVRSGDPHRGTTQVNAPTIHVVNEFRPTFSVRGDRRGPVYRGQPAGERRRNFLWGVAAILLLLWLFA